MLTGGTVELELPSDRDLAMENKQLYDRVARLERINEALQLRMQQTIVDWKRQQDIIKMNEVSDILSDYLSAWYHSELLRYLKSDGGEFVPVTWTDVATRLKDEASCVSGRQETRQRCMAMANMSEEEWDELYHFKKVRNMRVHPPRRNQAVIVRVMKELPPGCLKSALGKMFATMNIGK